MIRMKKTRRTSYMVSGWIESLRLEAEGGGTACLTLGCPDDFYAVRLGFPNISSDAWRLTKIIGRASEAFNDFVTPIGPSPWVTFRPASATGNTPFDPDNDSPIEEICVAGKPPSDPRDIAWTWTDWAPIASVAPAQPNGLRPLFLRALVPSEQTVSYAVGQLRTLLGNHPINHGFDTFIGGIKFNFDRVSNPESDETAVIWIDNQLAVGSLFPLVQFMTKNPGLTGLVVGDSHQQGTSTTEQFANFAFRAVAAVMPDHIGSVPLGFVNAAVGGLTSAQSFRRMMELIDEVRPSYVILPGWTYNDQTGDIRADRRAMEKFFARLLMAIEQCEARGILPVLMTPLPRDAESMGPLQLEPWHWLRAEILEMGKRGAVVLDAAALLGRMSLDRLDGTYRPEFTSDNMHPNDDGHAAAAGLLISLLNTERGSPKLAGPVPGVTG